MTPTKAPRIYVLAGVNGAGKSSIGGALIRESGADYYNPDEVARKLVGHTPGLGRRSANSAAWLKGKELLERTIQQRLNFAFESTLGATTIPTLLADAAKQGFELHIWYAGLEGPELHIQRVRARVRKGGHDIPEADIRRRYDRSRMNLIDLLPLLTTLRVYDNTAEADPARGVPPKPTLVLHMERGKIFQPPDISQTPEWAKPIVAAALKLHGKR